MLAQLKAKRKDFTMPFDEDKPAAADFSHQPDIRSSEDQEDDKEATKMTCDVLCSLSNATSPIPGGSAESGSPVSHDSCPTEGPKRKSSKTCPKQLQLPMFLSKTYHMIDRCDPEIATWSETGDNFVVKNVEQFASNVLPLYFKHSNFSSFARQLNFYGFRKLRTDPILTSDVDPRTACYVRFYHEKFQKDKPGLLHQIKRATKTDQQSKDDMESLKQEVAKLKETLNVTAAQYDQKLAELSYECNRRITAMTAEYDKLAAMVHHLISSPRDHSTAAAAVALRDLPTPAAPSAAQVPDLLHSLSQAAMSVTQNQLRSNQTVSAEGNGNAKRPPPSDEDDSKPSASRRRYS